MTVILELLTALLEYLDLFDRFVPCSAMKALLLPQNASIIPDSLTHTYYAQNYAGILIASSLLSLNVISIYM